jgi:hypothetical protein
MRAAPSGRQSHGEPPIASPVQRPLPRAWGPSAGGILLPAAPGPGCPARGCVRRRILRLLPAGARRPQARTIPTGNRPATGQYHSEASDCPLYNEGASCQRGSALPTRPPCSRPGPRRELLSHGQSCRGNHAACRSVVLGKVTKSPAAAASMLPLLPPATRERSKLHVRQPTASPPSTAARRLPAGRSATLLRLPHGGAAVRLGPRG